ncbi:hypothetical protein DPEC_G00206200 [Dallia pectoralis]|uniref:Uncharacterized protein n=1 Tax=Dallia pectoralis TaxID=75939 RepID=A0ACC2G4J7_DALPE|nr:hypothetical protein DPEC_G00206200 [Dallia pectoralis]
MTASLMLFWFNIVPLEGANEANTLDSRLLARTVPMQLLISEQNYDVWNRELLTVKLQQSGQNDRLWCGPTTEIWNRCMVLGMSNLMHAQVVSKDERPKRPPATIVPRSCLVRAVLWQVDENVRTAQLKEPGSDNGPPGSPRVLKWAHAHQPHLSPRSRPYHSVPM